MAKIDLGDIFEVARHAIHKPGKYMAGEVMIVRKKHNRISTTPYAIESRKQFAKLAQECAGKPIEEFLACIKQGREGKKFGRTAELYRGVRVRKRLGLA